MNELLARAATTFLRTVYCYTGCYCDLRWKMCQNANLRLSLSFHFRFLFSLLSFHKLFLRFSFFPQIIDSDCRLLALHFLGSISFSMNREWIFETLNWKYLSVKKVYFFEKKFKKNIKALFQISPLSSKSPSQTHWQKKGGQYQGPLAQQNNCT